MTWIARALAALRRPAPARKAAAYAFPEWLRAGARWSLGGNYARTVEEGYRLNALVYTPVRIKARAIASVPLLAHLGNPANPEPLPPGHPLAALVRQPNRWQTWRAFNEQRKTYLELAGNAFVLADRRGGRVAALYNLRPDRVRIVPSADGLAGYFYTPPGAADGEGRPLLPADVAHTKYPNPLDELEGLGYGLPPLLAAARDADTDNNVTAFIKALFERGAMPMGMLRFDVPLTEEDADMAKRRFMEKHAGYAGWTEPVVIDQGGGYERIGMTFDEMGFDVLDARAESRILSAFGVPPILAGTRYGIAHSTYSNYAQARAQFWQDVLLPELRMFEDDDRRLLETGDGATVAYDLTAVPALQQDLPPLVEAAHTLWTMGVPVNQAAAAVGLTLDRLE